MGSDFWRGLIACFGAALIGRGTISREDLYLFVLVDKAQEVVDAIFAQYEERGLEPSAEERETLLHL